MGLLVVLHSSGRRDDFTSCAHDLSRTNFISMGLVKSCRPTVAMATRQLFYLAQGLVALGFEGEGGQLQVGQGCTSSLAHGQSQYVPLCLRATPVGTDVTTKIN